MAIADSAGRAQQRVRRPVLRTDGGRLVLTKRSFTIQGHRTSVALEPEFWAAFDAAVARRATTPTALVTQIDEARDRPLASALRTFLLAEAGAGAACR